jgi:hypothetical protein
MFWPQHTSLNKQAAITPMHAVNLGVSGEDCLNQMIALIVGSRNPDPFGLINRWRKHSSHSLSVSTTLAQAPTSEALFPVPGTTPGQPLTSIFQASTACLEVLH